jgi:hypothetical protein
VSQFQRLERHFKELGRLGRTVQTTRTQRHLLSLLSCTLISGIVTEDSATTYGDENWAIQWIEIKASVLALCSVFIEGNQLFQRRCLAIVFCLPGATVGAARLQRQAEVVRSVRLAWRLKPMDGSDWTDETESDAKVKIYHSSMIL